MYYHMVTKNHLKPQINIIISTFVINLISININSLTKVFTSFIFHTQRYYSHSAKFVTRFKELDVSVASVFLTVEHCKIADRQTKSSS